LFGSRKAWVAFATGITAAAIQLAPILALIFGWDAAKVQIFREASDHLANLVAALGGLVVLAIGAEDTAHKLGLPPPRPGAIP
jgi:hypothetical protein